MYQPSDIENEKRLRIRLLLAAYFYEYGDGSFLLMTDQEFDNNCEKVNIDIFTGNPIMDKFFKEKFLPSTGQWIRDLPHIEFIKLKNIVNLLEKLK